MKSKAVYATLQDIRGNLDCEYDVYTSKFVKNKNNYLDKRYVSKDFACQFDCNICTCKRHKPEGYKYFDHHDIMTSRQVYTSQRYTSDKGFTDVGVGSIKLVQRKRVRRIYLPETEDRGVGSSDLTSFIRTSRNRTTSYYDQKKTSSKCIGGMMEYKIPSMLSERLSPICKTKSGCTSSIESSSKEKSNNDITVVSAVLRKKIIKGDKISNGQGIIESRQTQVHTNLNKRNKYPVSKSKIKSTITPAANEEQLSSDSLIQHVHNLEYQSPFQHSKTSVDILEEKLENEYIKVLPQVSKQNKSIIVVQNCANTSLKKRFQALKRDIMKKEVSVEDVLIKSSNQNITIIRKDVSITSDPPSLEGRSYTYVKIYSPVPSHLYKYEDVPQTFRRKFVTGQQGSYCSAIKDQGFNLMQQTIQAWIVSIIITDKPRKIIKRKNKNIEVTFSNQKNQQWFIDKSKAFSRQIEFVLHSKNVEKDNLAQSSEYIVIDISKGYFSKSSNESEEEKYHTSDEKVFNVVEYETLNSSSYLRTKRNDRKRDTADYKNDIQVKVTAKQNKDNEANDLEKDIKTPLLHRDVIVQGSNVYVPKRCDLISIGIITQHNHDREMRQSVLGMPEEITNDDSRHKIPPQKKCEFAKSYLQDYYRNWIPLDIDSYSWFISDSNLPASSDNNSIKSFNNQGDLSKSCPNFCEDYQTSAEVSSCTGSSRSQCMIVKETTDETTSYFNELMNKEEDSQPVEGKRILPKDSLEVFKHRKIHEESKIKADWCTSQIEPFSKPSIEDKSAQKLSNESICDVTHTKSKRIKIRLSFKELMKMGDSVLTVKRSGCCKECKKYEPCSKHVSIKRPCNVKKAGGCIMAYKGAASCSKCKKREPCSKHVLVNSELKCKDEIQHTCLEKNKPPCSVKSSPTHITPSIPTTPGKSPSICKQLCSPILPTSASYLERSSSSPTALSHTSLSRSLSKLLPCCKQSSQKSTSPKQKSTPRSSPPPPPPPSLPMTSKTLSFSKFVSLFKSKPTSPELQKLPCMTKEGSLPCASLKNKESSMLSPSLSQNKRYSPNTESQPPCKDLPRSCIKLQQPPCLDSSSQGLVKGNLISHSSPPLKKHSLTRSPQKELSRKEQLPPCSSKSLNIKCLCKKKTSTGTSNNNLLPTKPSSLTQSRPLVPQSFYPCGCSSYKSCGLPQCLSNKKSPFSPNELYRKNLDVSVNLSDKAIKAFKRFVKYASSLKNKDSKDCSPKAPRTDKRVKKENSNSSILLIPSLQPCQPDMQKSKNQSKMSGVHLKKFLMPENVPEDSKLKCNIQLNSKENLAVGMKPLPPSTEEIREGYNIKVVDEDGQTLYEREEFKMDTTQARKHVVNDMYIDSRIQRISTSRADAPNEKTLEFCDSNASLSNIVEINLNLKFKPVEKTRDINKQNCDNTPKDNQNESVDNLESTEVYAFHDKTKQSFDRIKNAQKKDVNIKIIINSCQQSPTKSKRRIKQPNLNAEEEFSKKNSEKFHTVSTAYSEVLEEQHTYLVHRTTGNLTSEHIKSGEQLLNNNEEPTVNTLRKIVTDTKCVMQHFKSEHSVISVTVDNVENTESELLSGNISQKYIESNLDNIDTHNKKCTRCISATDNKEVLFSDLQSSRADISKIRNKEILKKKILRQIFEDSTNSTTTGKKGKMRRIKKMLRAVLTSDSSCVVDVIDESVNHKLAQELAYHTLKPNFFEDTNSMTNYYQNNTSISDMSSSANVIDEILHATEEKNSCLCSDFANKLNVYKNNNFKACCCRSNTKKDKEIDCNLTAKVKIKNNVNNLNLETQNSNSVTNETESSAIVCSSKEPIGPHYAKNIKLRNLLNKIRSYSYSTEERKLNKQIALKKSDDYNAINSETVEYKSCVQNTDKAKLNPIDVLQLYETKKAVLSIYTEKTLLDTGEYLIAKLPKFDYKTESEIRQYAEPSANFQELRAKDLFMMSMTR